MHTRCIFIGNWDHLKLSQFLQERQSVAQFFFVKTAVETEIKSRSSHSLSTNIKLNKWYSLLDSVNYAPRPGNFRIVLELALLNSEGDLCTYNARAFQNIAFNFMNATRTRHSDNLQIHLNQQRPI